MRTTEHAARSMDVYLQLAQGWVCALGRRCLARCRQQTAERSPGSASTCWVVLDRHRSRHWSMLLSSVPWWQSRCSATGPRVLTRPAMTDRPPLNRSTDGRQRPVIRLT